MDIAKVRKCCEDIETLEDELEDLNSDLMATNDEVSELKQQIAEKLTLQEEAMKALKQECGMS